MSEEPGHLFNTPIKEAALSRLMFLASNRRFGLRFQISQSGRNLPLISTKIKIDPAVPHHTTFFMPDPCTVNSNQGLYVSDSR